MLFAFCNASAFHFSLLGKCCFKKVTRELHILFQSYLPAKLRAATAMALGVILFLHHPAVLADPAPVKVSSEQQHGSVFPVADPRGDAAETYRVMESVLERTRSRT